MNEETSTNPRRLPQPDKSLWDASRATETLTVAQGAQLVHFSTPRFRRWLDQDDGPRSLTTPKGEPVTTRDWIAFAWKKLNKAIGEETELEKHKQHECIREARRVGYSSSVSGVSWNIRRQRWQIVIRWEKRLRYLGYYFSLPEAEHHARRLARIRDSNTSWAAFKSGDYDDPGDTPTRKKGDLPIVDDRPVDPTLPTHSDAHTTAVAAQRERLIARRQRALEDHHQ